MFRKKNFILGAGYLFLKFELRGGDLRVRLHLEQIKKKSDFVLETVKKVILYLEHIS